MFHHRIILIFDSGVLVELKRGGRGTSPFLKIKLIINKMSDSKTLLIAYINGLSDSDCEKLWNHLNSETIKKPSKHKRCKGCGKQLRRTINYTEGELCDNCNWY